MDVWGCGAEGGAEAGADVATDEAGPGVEPERQEANTKARSTSGTGNNPKGVDRPPVIAVVDFATSASVPDASRREPVH